MEQLVSVRSLFKETEKFAGQTDQGRRLGSQSARQ